MHPVVQSALWFAAGVAVSAAVLLVGRNNTQTDLAEPTARVEAVAGFHGAVSADVVRVVDGDTFEATARIWLGQSVDVKVRIAGIDAPELKSRCDSEHVKAEAAKAYLAKRIENGAVWLSEIRYDKYGGRIRAQVNDDGGDVGADMIKKGYARPYHGERRGSWCLAS